MIPGVVETGLFIGMTYEVHVGKEDGVYVLSQRKHRIARRISLLFLMLI